MSSNEILQEIWQSYQSTIDCFKIADRSVDKVDYHLLHKTNFLNISPEKADELIRKSRLAADDYVILSLWAVFERKLFEYLQRLSQKISDGNGSALNKRLQYKIENEIEYWRLDDILAHRKCKASKEIMI
ncbi:MAG: hypothetical protein HQK77_19115 [Desulfobacterales bacterium]|nr:hypothetical protein [Desulfobacterales bacterium]